MAHNSAADTRVARRKFEKDAAKALAKLAHVLMIDYLRGWNDATKKNIRLAEKALEKAYKIHGSVIPLAHVAESKIREVRGDLEGSIESLDAALKLDPDLTDAYAHKANALILLGKPEDALAELKTATELGRGDPEPGLLDWFKGRAYFMMGVTALSKDQRLEWLKKSIDSLKKSRGVRATTWFTWTHLISAYALTGELGEAKAALDDYCPRFPAYRSLANIKKYYDQKKYLRGNPRVDEALKEYYSGLEKAGFPPE
jgi:tetratricopeptide (TPR) repeat protein